MTKIGIASDHAGYEMKEFLVGYLSAMGYDVHDFGPGSPESVDYADYAHPLAAAVSVMPPFRKHIPSFFVTVRVPSETTLPEKLV